MARKATGVRHLLATPSILISLLVFGLSASGSPAEDSGVAALALTPTGSASSNASSDSWQRLLFNQAKYDHRYANRKPKPELPLLQPKQPSGDSAPSTAATNVPFEEQDYRLEEVLMRPGQMIELLGLSNYLPRYMRFERPPEAANKWGSRHSATYDKDYDYYDVADDEGDDDDDRGGRRGQKPSLEQLLMVPRRSSKHLRRRRHRASRRARRRRDEKNNQLAFLRRPQRRRLRRYLLEATACRVAPGWRDLGKAFWPRWLRQGECRQPPSGSCSIPSGMRCQPDRKRRLYVLRYLCARHWHRSQCRWVRQSMQVLRSCKCSCS
ncbi:hypothetical protein BOX15_Mlig029943g3 [Macrostomum lignano]|uniref:Uncharacterized protein n=3 Tax=Macrostomum lignano TaxID=282301 RepID=A0A267EU92_9PLAT|nr:hypothetical protein BOX15_Mlig029943g2 [Macrostomum lignano]PAA78872.1 hypothetical protein BOX15_Mlig029943g3 [Macrostomum lignano]